MNNSTLLQVKPASFYPLMVTEYQQEQQVLKETEKRIHIALEQEELDRQLKIHIKNRIPTNEAHLQEDCYLLLILENFCTSLRVYNSPRRSRDNPIYVFKEITIFIIIVQKGCFPLLISSLCLIAAVIIWETNAQFLEQRKRRIKPDECGSIQD
ncbi:MAG: hypothetical protein EZS28_051164 [Streblomastix strix]|uniref:Uncharacterized protein n=1 Tax=Streblomastix strix TaxID=222440 RepID=A0A5J4T4H0_9EUKA|nr:MAG: hypothetical protein EZS28_051164 [Streblomastix strix]